MIQLNTRTAAPQQLQTLSGGLTPDTGILQEPLETGLIYSPWLEIISLEMIIPLEMFHILSRTLPQCSIRSILEIQMLLLL